MIEKRVTTAYYAPTRNRKYLTLKAACENETKAQIYRKYPKFKGQYGPTEVEEFEKLYHRLYSYIYNKAKRRLNVKK